MTRPRLSTVATRLVLALSLGLVLLGALASVARAAEVVIPAEAASYRRMLEREAALAWGLSAPIARLAAQLHQESHFDPRAESPFAQGLAQFTPPTAEWIAEKFPDELSPADPWDAEWSVRALVIYDAWLVDRIDAADGCAQWAFSLSAYNGGLTWVRRDQAQAKRAGADPAQWFGHVELHSTRARWAYRENRAYVRRILHVLEPAYIDAGWPGERVCN